MNKISGNGLTLEELEKIEEAAHRSQTFEAKTVLRLAAALREALQLKANECAFCIQLGKRRAPIVESGDKLSGKKGGLKD